MKKNTNDAKPIDRKDFESRLAELRPRGDNLERAAKAHAALDAEFQAAADAARARLLPSSLAWAEDAHDEAAWLRRASDGLATTGFLLGVALLERRGAADRTTIEMIARTLARMGDTIKWDVAGQRPPRLEFAKAHALLRPMMAANSHREPLQRAVEGREAACTIESLYFRALLLARFASGSLTVKQVEILDAWMWMWMPALEGLEEAPAGSPLRADLDTSHGLCTGLRTGHGPSLYLPTTSIEEAYRAILREFHAGRLVPAEGITTSFRIEEHVAVLEVVRRGLRESVQPSNHRAERHATNIVAELHVGLGELMERGFLPPAPQALLTLAVSDGQRVDAHRDERDRDTAVESIYERRRRMVRVANVSDTGLGIEGNDADCGGISAGDVVALRLEAGGPLEICKVARSVPSPVGRVWIGARRISSQARPIEVVQPVGLAGSEDVTLVFVPGLDESGRHDACLVSERAFEEGGPLEAFLGDCVYTFKFNRVRDRGRGWVLAGFEIVAAGTSEIRVA